MEMKCHPGGGGGGGLMVDPLPLQSAGVEAWYRGTGVEPTVGRWRGAGGGTEGPRLPLMERYCSSVAAAAAAAAAASAARYGDYDEMMFAGDKAVDCLQRYRTTPSYVNYRPPPFADVTG